MTLRCSGGERWVRSIQWVGCRYFPFILALGHLWRHSLQSVFDPVPGISRVRLTGLWCLLVWSNASLDVAEKACLRWSKDAYLLSCVRPFVPPWTVARQAPLSMGFPGKNTGVGCHALLHGSSRPRDQAHASYVSCMAGGFCATRAACVVLSFLVVSDSAIPWTVTSRHLCPWGSPSRNTGVGCHALLRGSSQPRIGPRSPALQADSSWSELPEDLFKWERKWKLLSRVQLFEPRGLRPARFLCPWDSPGQNTGVGSCSLLQGIFPNQGLNPGLLHWDRFISSWATREAQE